MITGHVVDFDREPVPNARVRAYALLFRGARTIISPVARAETDDLGEYRLYDLWAGKYIIATSPPRLGTTLGESGYALHSRLPHILWSADPPAAYVLDHL